jgi:V/A-type H+-transporting ATPase subunit E
MEGKEAIISYILDEAAAAETAAETAAAAKKEREIREVREEMEAKAEKARIGAQNSASLILSRRESAARIDGAKLVLKAKQKLIDAVYARAKESVLNLSDASYRELIGGYIVKYADEGDEVITARNDHKRLSAEFIKQISDKFKLGLTLGAKTHDDLGGVILRGSLCDKNLTLSSIIDGIREKTESEVIKKLFT